MERKSKPEISEEKRQQILSHALGVFVANGYVGTSTDQLAAAASVSKQTLYRAFGDKEGLFTALIHAACDRVHDPFAPLINRMEDAESAETAIRMLAEQFASSILSSDMQQLRRLVIAEAVRFPELGRLYWERGFVRMLASIARCLTVLDRRSLLRVANPEQSAQQFAGMLLWIPSNRIMFLGASSPIRAEELRSIIDDGVDAFLRAHSLPNE